MTRGLEGSVCLYTDGLSVTKARILGARVEASCLTLRLQPLRSLTPGKLVDDAFHLSAQWKSVQRTSTYLNAPYDNWKLFFDPGLIEEVTAMATRGDDLKTIKRVLQEHRMKATA